MPKVLMLLLVLMMAVLSGCNSEYASLGRISNRNTFITQLGSITKMPGLNNSGQDFCRDMAIDRFENIFCFGVTNGSMGITGDGTADAFVAKFNRHGTLQWVKQFGSPLGIEGCRGGGVDKYGNAYCGGSTTRLLDSDPVYRIAVTPTLRVQSDSDTDAFVAKLDTNGNILWIKQFGGMGDEACQNLAVSPEGNAYCGARTNDLMGYHHADGLIETIGSTTNDAWMSKIDSNGSLIWTRQLAGRAGALRNFDDSCNGIAIDHEENVYCGGSTNGSLLGPNGSGADGGSYDIFVWVVDKDGIPVFRQQLGGGTTHPDLIAVNAGEQCYDIAVDKDKNFFCAALISASSFAEGAGGNGDIALIKWNSSFSIEWIKQLGNTTVLSGPNNADETPEGITVSGDGTILIAGSTTGNTVKTNAGAADVLLITFDQAGNVTGAEQTGTSMIDTCVSPLFDSAKNVNCSGSTFGSLGEANAGSSDALIVRFENLIPFQ